MKLATLAVSRPVTTGMFFLAVGRSVGTAGPGGPWWLVRVHALYPVLYPGTLQRYRGVSERYLAQPVFRVEAEETTEAGVAD